MTSQISAPAAVPTAASTNEPARAAQSTVRELDVAAVPDRPHLERDENERRDEEHLSENAHSPLGRTLGDGRAKAKEALARHHDPQ